MNFIATDLKIKTRSVTEKKSLEIWSMIVCGWRKLLELEMTCEYSATVNTVLPWTLRTHFVTFVDCNVKYNERKPTEEGWKMDFN